MARCVGHKEEMGFKEKLLHSFVLRTRRYYKEYGVEDNAIREIKTITQQDGLLVIATPNNEMLPDHGFSFDEIDGLMNTHFRSYCIFENALAPYAAAGPYGKNG